MIATIGNGGATLTREAGDAKLRKESSVAFHLKKLLSAQGWHFVNYRGIRHEMTGCKLGLIDHKAKVILWHERYAVEDAAKAFNAGNVFLARVDIKGK
jgi:hypothetical protein